MSGKLMTIEELMNENPYNEYSMSFTDKHIIAGADPENPKLTDFQSGVQSIIGKAHNIYYTTPSGKKITLKTVYAE